MRIANYETDLRRVGEVYNYYMTLVVKSNMPISQKIHYRPVKLKADKNGWENLPVNQNTGQ